MKRQPLLDLLDAYVPDSLHQQETKRRFLDFVTNEPDCFKRSLPHGHVTASSWLLDHTHTRALLLLHAQLNIWCQPGGHCDGDSDTLAVAMKEAQEESGLSPILPLSPAIFDLDIHTIPGTHPHLHYDVRFLLHTTSTQDPIPNEESRSLIWISSSLPTQDPSILRMHTKWLLKKKASLGKPEAGS